MRWLALWSLLVVPCAVAQAGPGTPGQWLSFSVDRDGPSATHYDIRVDRNTGHGFYHGSEGTTPPAAAETTSAETPISVDPQTLKKLFAAVPFVEAHRCESHSKNLAQTGKKILRYQQNDVVAECTFNYADNDRVNTATTLFMAIGETMMMGDRLAAKLRFDRLGLDVEMDNLESALNDGRAVEVGNIAPVLESIQNDERVMERVRRKAAHLLETAGVPVAESGPSER